MDALIPKDYLPERLDLDGVVEGLIEFLNSKEDIDSQKWRRILTLEGEEYMRHPEVPLVPESYDNPVKLTQRRDHIEYDEFSLDIVYDGLPEGYSVKCSVQSVGHTDRDLNRVGKIVEEYFSTVSFK